MKTSELKASPREDFSKQATKQLRRAGKVPAVIYNNSQADHIVVDFQELRPSIFTSDTYIIQLDVDGKKRNSIVREMQFHPVTEKLLHVDFLEVSDDKSVVLDLPIKLTGTAAGIIKGGKLRPKLRKLKVRGVPAELPESVSVDVTPLDLGQTIKVKDAEIEGLDIVTPPSAAVASVEIPRALRSEGAADEEGGEEGEEEAAAAEE